MINAGAGFTYNERTVSCFTLCRCGRRLRVNVPESVYNSERVKKDGRGNILTRCCDICIRERKQGKMSVWNVKKHLEHFGLKQTLGVIKNNEFAYKCIKRIVKSESRGWLDWFKSRYGVDLEKYTGKKVK